MTDQRRRSTLAVGLVVLILLLGCAVAFVLISQGNEVDQLKTETERLSTAYEAIRSDTSANSEEIAAGDDTPPEAGATGAPGAPGAAAVGRDGRTGQTGAAGVGVPGATGATGVGTPGATGATGATGIGVPGADGADGADGVGSPGPPGPTCPAGFSQQLRVELPSTETWMVCVQDPP